jgi:drug/metabolite transporter (DMT)-like permease
MSSHASSPRSRADDRTLAILAVSATTVAWGAVPIILRQIDMPILGFASWRLAIGAVLLQLALLATGRRLRLSTIRACWPGGVFYAADLVLSFGAFRITSVASATVIGALAPIFIAVGASRLFGERFGRREVLFALLSFAGVGLVAVGSAGSAAWNPIGDLLALGSVVAWTAYWLFSKRARQDVSALEYMATATLVGAVLVVAITAIGGVSLAPPEGPDWAWLWIVVLIPGTLGHLGVAWAHRHLEAWLSSLITQCQPVVASILAWVVLDQPLTPLVITGGLLVIGATGAIVIRSARGSPAERSDVRLPETRSVDPAG